MIINTFSLALFLLLLGSMGCEKTEPTIPDISHSGIDTLQRNDSIAKDTTISFMQNGDSLKLQKANVIDGVYALHLIGMPFDENCREAIAKPWIDGYSYRVYWNKIETSKGNYDFTEMDEIVNYVKSYNEQNNTHKKVQIRITDGVGCPDYLDDMNINYIESEDFEVMAGIKQGDSTFFHPDPVNNPVLLERLRLLYREICDRYINDRETVSMIHGTWIGGHWSEILVTDSLKKRYSREEITDGLINVANIFLSEVITRGYTSELSFSGIFSPDDINHEAIIDHLESNLGRKSPRFFINTNGWGEKNYGPDAGTIVINMNKPHYFYDLWKTINLGVQQFGANGFPNRHMGDYVEAFNLAMSDVYRARYAEIFVTDIAPVTDYEHRIVEGCENFRNYLSTLPVQHLANSEYLYVHELEHDGFMIDTILIEGTIPISCTVEIGLAISESDAITPDFKGWRSMDFMYDKPLSGYLHIRVAMTTRDSEKTPALTGLNIRFSDSN